MDAQKIAVAASEIKKADHALKWLDQHGVNEAITIDTKGPWTSHEGHGEASYFLRNAMEFFIPKIVEMSKEMAYNKKSVAQQTIRNEAEL